MAEPRDSLERVVVSLEAAGETEAAGMVELFLAGLDEPKPAKAAPAKRTTAKTKEG